MKFHLEKATDGKHKFIGVFQKDDHETRVPFGAKGYEDMTMHKNELRRQAYIQRHKSRENWSIPTTAGSLSRYILWETANLNKNIHLFKERFNLE